MNGDNQETLCAFFNFQLKVIRLAQYSVFVKDSLFFQIISLKVPGFVNPLSTADIKREVSAVNKMKPEEKK